MQFLYATRYCISKFQIIFLHMQHEDSKWKSLVLFNSSFAVGKLRLPAPSPLLTHDAAVTYATNAPRFIVRRIGDPDFSFALTAEH